MSKNIESLESNAIFCQQASGRYEKLLEEAGGDPRVAAGVQSLRDGRWGPTLDARDARVTFPENEKVIILTTKGSHGQPIEVFVKRDSNNGPGQIVDIRALPNNS